MVDVETPLSPPTANPFVTHPPDASAPATPPVAAATAWSPPPPVESGPSRPRGRAKFGAGILVGAAVTAAALGGYVAGQDSTPAAETAAPVVAAQPVASTSGSIADLVEGARPSIVSVRQQVTQSSPIGGSAQGQAAGTGFVLSTDGYIVTNNHVIADGDETTVTFADGSEESATIVAGDPSRDLAVLPVDRTDLVPLAVGDSDDLRLGDQLIAVGYALDLNGEPSVTSGILSAKNRSITESTGATLVNLLQTDTAINPGNSGGPLLNSRGEVVGINTAIAGQAQNIGFAIAITPVMDVIDELRGGSVPDRALMGVTTQPSADNRGAEILEFADGSGAATSALEVGDVITAVDDNEITDPESLGAAIATYQPGDEVTVTFERDGRSDTTTIVLGTKPT
jgi:putative serine protease PepD